MKNNALSDFIFNSKYSKYDPKLKRKETFEEAVDRIDNMHRDYLEVNYTHATINKEFMDDYEASIKSYKNKEFLGSQRGLQFGGAPILKNHTKLFNCSFTYVDRLEVFGQVEWVLLCGCGVGISVEKQHIDKIPNMTHNLNKELYTYKIEDSIEGWADAIQALIYHYFIPDVKYPKFDYSAIRLKGSPISGGFIAPGAEGLRQSLKEIEKILDKVHKTTKRLSSLDCADIISHCADSVLSGGLRRSALLILFDYDDVEMSECKTGNWFFENPQRARFNMSAGLNRDSVQRDIFSKLFKSTKEFGDPAFYFRSDSGVGPNPCVEIGFRPVSLSGESGFSFCNLVTINGNDINTREEFLERCKHAATLATVQASYMNFSYLGQSTIDIVKEDPLIGVSISGIMNSADILLNESILQEGAKIVLDQNAKIANILGINSSSRTTCVKPDGNSSVFLGGTPGCHGEHANKYIRRVQINKTEEAGQIYKKMNPHAVVNSIWSTGNTDNVIMFPIEAKPGSILKNELHGVNQLEIVKSLFQNWVVSGMRDLNSPIQNNVSNTVIVPQDEWKDVEDYIWENRNYLAGVSFIPATGDLDFNQAPYTEVLNPQEMIDTYGEGVIFASGLIVDTIDVFGDLWKACDCFMGKDEKISANYKDVNDLFNEIYTLKHSDYYNELHSKYLQAQQEQWKKEREILETLGYSDEFIENMIDNEIQIPTSELKKYIDNTQFSHVNNLLEKRDIMRRFEKFSNRYFDTDDIKMMRALKSVQLYHDWCDITHHHKEIDWTKVKWKNVTINVDETAGAACAGGQCEINRV